MLYSLSFRLLCLFIGRVRLRHHVCLPKWRSCECRTDDNGNDRQLTGAYLRGAGGVFNRFSGQSSMCHNFFADEQCIDLRNFSRRVTSGVGNVARAAEKMSGRRALQIPLQH
jgi:hypothetical protein